MQNELENRIEFEKLIAGMSTSFVKLGPGQVGQGIDRTLKEIGMLTGADRSYLFLLSEDGSGMSNTHEWCAMGIRPQMPNLQDIPVTDLPWIMVRLLLYKDVYIPDTAGLPPEARTEKENFFARGIKSLVAVPLVYNNLVYGFLGLDSVRCRKKWSEETIKLVRMAGEIFINALFRSRAEKGLRTKNEELLSTILQYARAREE
jgi:GAF domain-containing protein